MQDNCPGFPIKKMTQKQMYKRSHFEMCSCRCRGTTVKRADPNLGVLSWDFSHVTIKAPMARKATGN